MVGYGIALFTIGRSLDDINILRQIYMSVSWVVQSGCMYGVVGVWHGLSFGFLVGETSDIIS